MVKLFVGNLSPTTSKSSLRELFEKYGTVSECEIIRNYGFVHMSNEEEAKRACASLNNHQLDGKAIHTEFSTSKLRKAPGMNEVCFRCGEKSHKTNNCPMHDMINKDGSRSYNSLKRHSTFDDHPPPKRVECYFTPSKEAASSGFAYGYMKQSSSAPSYKPDTPKPDGDPLFPRPLDRNLSSLYDEYLLARDRYYYLRDRLSSATNGTRGMPFGSVQQAPPVAVSMFGALPAPQLQHHQPQPQQQQATYIPLSTAAPPQQLHYQPAHQQQMAVSAAPINAPIIYTASAAPQQQQQQLLQAAQQQQQQPIYAAAAGDPVAAYYQQAAPPAAAVVAQAQQQPLTAHQPQQLAVEYYSQAPPQGAAAAAAAVAAARSSPNNVSRYSATDVYYARTSNGYETMTIPKSAYQPAPAPTAHPPDVYYHRTENGYEAFTLPSVTGGSASATYVIQQ